LGAGKERLAQFALERVKTGGEGWLGHEHGLGGTTHVPTASDFEKPLNLSEQHSLAIDAFYGDVKGIAAWPMAGYSLK
jgi:hypothetical protein